MSFHSTSTSITTSSTSCPNSLNSVDNEGFFAVSGTFTGVTGLVQGSFDGTNYVGIRCYNTADGSQTAGGSTITLTDSTVAIYRIPDIQGMAKIRFLSNAFTTGPCTCVVGSGISGNGGPIAPAFATTFSSATFSGATFSGTASTFSVMPKIVTQTLAASGNAIGNAAQLLTGFSTVTGANGNAAILLPVTAAGLQCIVKSTTSGQILKVFPPVNSTINGAAANAVYNHANLAIRHYYAYNTTAWFTSEETPT